jgi:anti-sigma factor ChrR (cupin superfamily)
MQHLDYTHLPWIQTTTPGIVKAVVETNAEGGGLTFWKIPKGLGFARHGHRGYESIYLVQGCMNFSGIRMQVGDFLLTQEGEEHEAAALEDSVILVISQRKNT